MPLRDMLLRGLLRELLRAGSTLNYRTSHAHVMHCSFDAITPLVCSPAITMLPVYLSCAQLKKRPSHRRTMLPRDRSPEMARDGLLPLQVHAPDVGLNEEKHFSESRKLAETDADT